ncbi:MAG: hypothetical protein ACTTH7_04740 [Treponema sp.]
MAHQKTAQFKAVVAYIVQEASGQELAILTAAINRRTQRIAASRNPTPHESAQRISRSLARSLEANKDSIRKSLRKFAAEIIVQEAPEIPEAALSALLDSWIPPKDQAGGCAAAGNARKLPPQALYEMIVQFVAYSVGEMEQTEYCELTASMGDWTTRYWNIFPVSVKRTIKAFLTGSITAGNFRRIIEKIVTASQEPL